MAAAAEGGGLGASQAPKLGLGGKVGVGAWPDEGDKDIVAQSVPSQRAQGLCVLMAHNILGSKQLLQLL